MDVIKSPKPGSPEAVMLGCTCPTGDNGRGTGAYGGIKDAEGNPMFIVDPRCPLHGDGAVTDAAGKL